MALRDRLRTIRDLADDVLERVEMRWDQAMDVFHGRPIRDPYLDDPRQLPQQPGQPPPPPPGVEHEPSAEELAVNEDYEQAMWPDLGEEPEPDPVRTISEGEWLIPEPGVETRLHLGQSNEGFHYYVETARLGGDDGGPYWSKGYPTREMADDAGHQRLSERHYPELADLGSHAVTEVRARDWWEDQRAQILKLPLSVGRREQDIESLGPEPSDDAKVWLNGHGQRVEQPSVELEPIEIERPATEERADRDEHALGLEREEEHSQEHAELEL